MQGEKQPISNARNRANQTYAESKMWDLLRSLDTPNAHFRRQGKVGRFTVDFVARKARLVIEVDGGVHRLKMEADAERQRIIEAAGYRVLRFSNETVINHSDDVAMAVRFALSARADTPTP